MTENEFTTLVEERCNEFDCRVDDGLIVNAKEADEAAAELAGDSGLHPDSEEFDALLAVLFEHAGKTFSGHWEDYPIS